MSLSALDVFLRDHASVHLRGAVHAERNIDWLIDGLTEGQMRARPSGVNSLVWILWHLSRVEDLCISTVLGGRMQLMDDEWVRRLGVMERGDGEGMSKESVASLSESIQIKELIEYRAIVCTRTRELASSLWPGRWFEKLTERDLATAAELGGEAGPWLVGVTRESLLTWWAIHHAYHHIGQMALIRKLVQKER